MTIATQNVRCLGQGLAGRRKRKELKNLFKHTTPLQIFFSCRKSHCRKRLALNKQDTLSFEEVQVCGMKATSRLNLEDGREARG
jgi:hypothetical protein